ncbi:MAG TPA: division/cell wall cluster transcriptional repressor MraZ [Terriglobia bacterium]|nr:division/cell wall cluster transcriptional repressor MraZ [Terriglobia bacterium]
MLRGKCSATVDTKGRLKIPSVFKAVFEENYGPDVYITSLDGQYARVYPFSEWRKIEDRLGALSSMDKARNRLLDRTNYWGQMARMDTQGRILMPPQLREDAAVRGEVVVMGYLNHLQVWNPDRFREHLNQEPLADEDLQALSDKNI